MSRYIDADALLEFCNNAKSKTIDCNDIARFPSIDIDTCMDAISKHDLWRIVEDNAYWITYDETSKALGMTLAGINQALNECPPVEPKRPRGEGADTRWRKCQTDG